MAPLAYNAWTRIATTTPGITLTGRLADGAAYVWLLGGKTDYLTVTLTPAAQGATPIALPNALGSNNLVSGAPSPGANYLYSMSLQSLPLGQYGTLTANWGNITTSVPLAFYNVGLTRFSQYNTPYEPSCNSSPQVAYLVYKIDQEYCYYQRVSLGSTSFRGLLTRQAGLAPGRW